MSGGGARRAETAKPAGRSRAGLWAGVAALLIAAAIAAAWLPLAGWVAAFEGWLGGLGWRGVGLFALVYVVAAILLLPEWLLTIAAGLVYGAWGLPIVLVAATVGAGLAFLIARHFGRDVVRQMMQRRPLLAAIDGAVAAQGWKVVGLLRLSPLVPFNLQNYLFGVTAIPFWQFVAATFFGILPGAAFYLYLGILGRAATQGGAGPLKWLFFAIGLAATVAFVIVIARAARARLGAAVGTSQAG